MTTQLTPGLGELLRHLIEIVDRGSEAHYEESGIDFRPRFTPIMRALAQGPCTVNDITAQIQITQGAVSQTLALMEKEKLVNRKVGRVDTRQTIVSLTRKGEELLSALEHQWAVRFHAIEKLERETQVPLRAELMKVIAALDQYSFAQRLAAAEADLLSK